MLVQINVEDTNPQRARRICDAVVSTYMEQNLRKAVDASADAVVWLNGQLDHIKSDLEENENQLHAFKEQNQLPSTSINEASNMFRVELQTVRYRSHPNENEKAGSFSPARRSF